MGRLQFTLRDLFLMTTLIAVGMGGIAWVLSWEGKFDVTLVLALLIAFLACIGAGIVAPFRSQWNEIRHYGMIACRVFIAIICLVLGIAGLFSIRALYAQGRLHWVGTFEVVSIFFILAAIVFFPKKFKN